MKSSSTIPKTEKILKTKGVDQITYTKSTVESLLLKFYRKVTTVEYLQCADRNINVNLKM